MYVNRNGKDGITREFLKGATRGLRERKVRGRGGNAGKIEWKLSEVNTRTVSRGQNKLIGKFKMVAGDAPGMLWNIRTFQQKSKGSW